MKKSFPKAINLSRLLGPSFIMLAMGLGSGEIILWPYLVSHYGLGIAWGALAGITFQYFMNMEIERYALVKGESVFVGFAKLWRGWPVWFIVSTFIGFGLPGIIASSAQVLAFLFGLTNFKWLAIGLLITIGLILSLNKTVYGAMERLTKIILFIFLPLLLILTFTLTNAGHWTELAHGLIGLGNGFNFLPAGISLAVFLSAFAYAGAGGNLNLTQSIYVKEKGYGMGKYSQRLAGLFRARGEQKIKLTGQACSTDKADLKNFKVWWRRINAEHLLIFWFGGILAMALLMVLARVTVMGLSSVKDFSFLITEGLVISQRFAPVIGCLFIMSVGIMLFQAQLGIMDSISRIMAENLAIMKSKKNQTINLRRLYFLFLWAEIIFGCLLFLFNIYDPKTLLVAGALINAVAMFVHSGLTLILNRTLLPKVFQPKTWRQVVMVLIWLFFGVFSGIVLFNS